MPKTLLVIVLFVVFLTSAMPGVLYAAESTSDVIIKTTPSKYTLENDSRVKVLRHFLQSFNSPLAPFADTFVKEADENDLDWRFVAAISGVESTFGREIPYNSYNAWGWGIYGNNVIRFNSYDEAIKTISKGLKENYIDAWGANDVYQVGRFYAASPTWSQRVVYFMQKVDEFALNNPKTYLSLSL